MTDSKWIDKISALMRKAEDPATTEEERSSIVDKVTYLMTKYGIEQDMLAAKEQRPLTASHRIFKVVGSYADKKISLLHEICRAFGCFAVTKTGKSRVSVFGTDEDIERVFMLYMSLILQMDASLAAAQVLKPKHEHGRTFNNSFIVGYVLTVNRRIKEAARRAKEDIQKTHEGSGMELVLVNKATIVKNLMRDVYPGLRYSRASFSNGSDAGYGAGSAAGMRADIGGSRISSQHSARKAIG
jgi:hypothetical protein